METCFYEYWGKYWDEIDEVETEMSGVVYAESSEDAMSKIAKYYGDANISYVTLRGTDMSSIYECEVDKNA